MRILGLGNVLSKSLGYLSNLSFKYPLYQRIFCENVEQRNAEWAENWSDAGVGCTRARMYAFGRTGQCSEFQFYQKYSVISSSHKSTRSDNELSKEATLSATAKWKSRPLVQQRETVATETKKERRGNGTKSGRRE